MVARVFAAHNRSPLLRVPHDQLALRRIPHIPSVLLLLVTPLITFLVDEVPSRLACLLLRRLIAYKLKKRNRRKSLKNPSGRVTR